MYEIHHPPNNTKVITQLFKRLSQTERPQKAKQYLRQKGFQTHNENIGFIPKNYPGHHAPKLIETCGKHALLQPLSRNGSAFGMKTASCSRFATNMEKSVVYTDKTSPTKNNINHNTSATDKDFIPVILRPIFQTSSLHRTLWKQHS